MEDHPIVMESLGRYFKETERWNIMGTASSLAEAKEKLLGLCGIDVLLMDIQLQDGWGIDIIPWMREQNLNMPLLAVYTAFDDYSYANAALSQGVKVFITKHRNKEELENAINSAFCGIVCIDEDAQAHINKVSNFSCMLTKRESEIFIHLKNGLSNKEIACKLEISVRTVENILSCIYDKTGIKSRHELEKM